MKRSEVQEQYKWKLEDIYATDEDWEKEFKECLSDVKKMNVFKGRLSSKKQLLACLKFSDETEKKLGRLYCYARMRRDENSVIDKYVSMSERAQNLLTTYASTSSYVSPELNNLSEEYIDKVMALPEFESYSYVLGEIKRKKQHTLPEREERLLAMASDALGACDDIYGKIDNIDLPLPKIKDEKGDKIRLTQGRYSMFMQSPSAIMRKHAFDALYKTYAKLINTITATYAGSVKADNFYAVARGYKSALEQALFEDNVPSAVYDNLLTAVSDNLFALHDYMTLRKKVLKVDKLHMYDMYVPIIDNLEMNWKYDEAYDTVVAGLSPMGNEYVELLRRAREEKWIDVYETENKRTGAYSWGCYGTHPYVLLNHSNTTHDLFTIAHEMGHALHTYYSNETQPYAKHQYSIFVAEVASTVNEVLLLKYLINNTTDKRVKRYLLTYYLDMFRTTLFRQTMFAEFEKISHDSASKGIALTPKYLCDKYYKLNKKYYGKDVMHDNLIRYEWARVPHFYSAFYVYKYATGLTAAVSIVSGILERGESAVTSYKRFLQSGGSDSPYELLKIAGVDLMDKAPFEVAMNEFKSTLDALNREFE